MATNNFSRALAATLRFEGGYVHHPSDPGGATNMGITLATLSGWRGVALGPDDVRAMTRVEAAAIYRRMYWELVGGDRLPAGIDLAVFDYAVNSGVGRASRALQKILGVAVDGIIGSRTIHAAASADAARIIRALCAQRRGFVQRLRIFTTFGRGWLRRIAAIEASAIAMVQPTAPAPVPASEKEKDMNYSKSVVESRTIWANVVGLAALGASLFGFDTAEVDQAAVLDAVLKSVAGISFVASTIFRITASKKLG